MSSRSESPARKRTPIIERPLWIRRHECALAMSVRGYCKYGVKIEVAPKVKTDLMAV
jgi:hypothetical protein